MEGASAGRQSCSSPTPLRTLHKKGSCNQRKQLMRLEKHKNGRWLLQQTVNRCSRIRTPCRRPQPYHSQICAYHPPFGHQSLRCLRLSPRLAYDALCRVQPSPPALSVSTLFQHPSTGESLRTRGAVDVSSGPQAHQTRGTCSGGRKGGMQRGSRCTAQSQLE